MRVKEKYTTDKTKQGEENKIEITKEAFATIETLELVHDELRKMRLR